MEARTYIILMTVGLIFGWVIALQVRTTQDHQHLSEQLSGIQQSIEIQISELPITCEPKCFLDDKTGYGLTNIPCPN